jgi:hypothetical protein
VQKLEGFVHRLETEVRQNSDELERQKNQNREFKGQLHISEKLLQDSTIENERVSKQLRLSDEEL